MTPEELRHIDAEVAMKVMGWHRGGEPAKDNYWADEHGDWQGDIAFVLHDDEVWTPSVSIESAWQVVERLRLWVFPREDGQWCAGPEGERTDYVYVDPLAGVVDGHLAHIECADTAPLAICRAALACVSPSAASH